MAIKDPLMFITIEEFKNWKGFNKLEFDDTTTPDNEIWFAISVASNNIDYLSGFEISKKWPETKLTEFTDIVQTATAYYVRFLLTKDSNYIRGQSSTSQGGMTYSENNPTDPYFIVPEVFNCLRKIKEYPNITGFNLDVLPKRNDFFSNFYSNCGEDSPLTRYLELINLKTNDTRVKIYPKHPKNLIGTELWIDTTGIKSFDNLTTIELFTKYFSNDTMKLVDGKEGQEKKVISTNTSGNSLWEINKDNPNFIVPKDDKGIDVNGKRIIDVGTPTFLSDATTKLYVDNLLDKKQNKLIAGENITIDKDNKISAISGGNVDENRIFDNKDDKDSTTRLVNEVIKTNVGGKTLIYRNNPVITDDLDIPNKKYIDDKIPNLDNYYKKEEVNKKLEDTEKKFPVVFALNAVTQEIPNLETTNKTIAGAINEIVKKESKEKWVVVGKSVDNRTWEDFTLGFNKYYRVFITWDSPPFNQTIVKLKVEFKSSGYIGGDYMLVKSKINDEDVSLIIKLGTVNSKSQLVIIGGNKKYANIFSLEELQNTVKVDINKPLKIKSSSLETNKIEENYWDIELKENPTPTPCPCPKWKEVGTKVNINHIKYTFKSNTKYKIYYNFESQFSNKKFAFICKEFLYGELNTDVQTLDWDNINGRIMLSLQMQNDTIAIVSDPTRFGQLLKLEELQE